MRKKCGYTQKQVAGLLGLDRSTYSYYELGKIKPDIKTIMKLSDIFNVHYTAILEPEDRPSFSDVGKSTGAQQPNQNKNNIEIPVDSNLTKEEQNVLIAFRLLSDKSQKDALEFISKKFKDDRNLGQHNKFTKSS